MNAIPDSAVSQRAILVAASVHKGLRATDGKTRAKTLNSRCAIVNPKVVEVNETSSYDVSNGSDKMRS